ncbi:hypothetical protein M1466_02025 [Candidatus Dependentiae bacterium]|nr:hypothetical protein [Candidatus Dependentiae bacterium]
MRVVIKSPTETLTNQVAWLEIQTAAGGMIIMQSHAPMVVPLKPNSQLIMMVGTLRQQYQVIHGIAHIMREGVLILLG